MIELEVEPWTVDDAAELYEVARWGNGYFGINEAGHVCVLPNKDATKPIDLKQLVDRLQLRGIDLPILIRFAGILQASARARFTARFKARSPSTNIRATIAASIRSK